jgi:hypothetical protein
VERNGRDVTTWTERRFDLPEWYRLTVAGGTLPGTVLPLTEGVVLLQSLTVAETGAPAEARETIASSGTTADRSPPENRDWAGQGLGPRIQGFARPRRAVEDYRQH